MTKYWKKEKWEKRGWGRGKVQLHNRKKLEKIWRGKNCQSSRVANNLVEAFTLVWFGLGIKFPLSTVQREAEWVGLRWGEAVWRGSPTFAPWRWPQSSPPSEKEQRGKLGFSTLTQQLGDPSYHIYIALYLQGTSWRKELRKRAELKSEQCLKKTRTITEP